MTKKNITPQYTIVAVLPSCDFSCTEKAEYDFKTKTGSWANGCAKHWKANRASALLGTGHGQELRLPAKKSTASLSDAAKTDTREAWLRRAVPHLALRISTATSHQVPPGVQVSVGFARGSKKAIGQCIDAQGSVDGETRNISICPTIADGVRVLDVLLHELVHAAVGCVHQHDKTFSTAARACGLEGKPTATVAGEVLKAELTVLATTLGKYPHVAVVARPAIAKPKDGESRWVRMYSKTMDGYLVNVPREQVEEYGPPTDPEGEEMVFDKPW